jgi:hypothetical protein
MVTYKLNKIKTFGTLIIVRIKKSFHINLLVFVDSIIEMLRLLL